MLKTVSSITNAIGALNYKGTWNASTNTPTITSSVGVKGDYYVVSVAGTTTIDGISNWGVGDWITFNGSVWQRVEGGADLNGVNITFTGTASGPTYETSNAATGLTITNNEIDADGTDTNINILMDPKGTGGVGIGGDPTGVVSGVAITSKFCVKHDGTGQVGGFVHANNTTAASGAGVFVCRSRGTIASPTVVQNGDRLATLSFAGYDGTDLALAAQIDVEVDGAPGSNDMPGRIRFLTTPDGTQAPVEAMKIDNAQNTTLANNLIFGTSGRGVLDTNGNESLLFTATASAVNELTIANAATTASPSISATGSDTDIGIVLAPKGTGAVVFPAGAVGTPAITTTGDLNTGIFFPAADAIAFVEGGAEAMRVDSTGALFIGKTADADATQGLSLFPSGSISYNDNNSGTRTALGFRRSGSQVGSITTTASTTAYNTSSDYRLKENVAPITGAIAKVLELNPVTYTWKVDGSAGEGFIAHEVQSIAPYAVTGKKDDEQMQSVDYGKLTPILTAALQEAIKKIEILEARIAELEAK